MMNDTTRLENISALLDNEIDDAQLDAVIAGLTSEDGKKAWDIYHQLGDVIRSEDLATPLSSGFSQKFAARFETEAIHFLPAQQHSNQAKHLNSRGRQYLRPYSLVAGAVAASIFSFFIAPQVFKTVHEPAATTAQQMVVRDTPAASLQLASASESAVVVSESTGKTAPANTSKKSSQVEMIRNPDLDSYLLAHQRFSPAISNGAQYVTRANAVSTSSDK